MGKIVQTICLNGKSKGLHTMEMPYTDDQEVKAKNSLKFEVDGIEFAGWCRECGRPVQKGDEKYFINVDGLGNVQADCSHRRCNRY